VLATRHRSIQVHPQVLPIAPGSHNPFPDLRQTYFVASWLTFAYSGQMLAALDRMDGAAVALGRHLRSSVVVFGQMTVYGLAEGADCTFVLQNFPSPAAHSGLALAVAVLDSGLAQAVLWVERPASSAAHASHRQSSSATWLGPGSPSVLLGQASSRGTSETDCRS
jgi:hypothetical protein